GAVRSPDGPSEPDGAWLSTGASTPLAALPLPQPATPPRPTPASRVTSLATRDERDMTARMARRGPKLQSAAPLHGVRESLPFAARRRRLGRRGLVIARQRHAHGGKESGRTKSRRA